MEKTYSSPTITPLHITPFRLLSGSGTGPNFNVGNSSITEASATTDAAARSFYDDDYDEEE